MKVYVLTLQIENHYFRKLISLDARVDLLEHVHAASDEIISVLIDDGVDPRLFRPVSLIDITDPLNPIVTRI